MVLSGDFRTRSSPTANPVGDEVAKVLALIPAVLPLLIKVVRPEILTLSKFV